MQNTPDDSLVQLAKRSNAGAFDLLVQRHANAVWRTARSVLGDDHKAEDAAQETFLKAWRSLGGFDGRASFATWIRRIALNTALNQQRSDSRRPVSLASSETLSNQATATDEAGQRSLEAAEILRKGLEQLPEHYREVILLREVEQMSYQEIAHHCKIAVRSVETRLARGRRLLARSLGASTKAREHP